MTESGTVRELPVYICHKKVRALKIKELQTLVPFMFKAAVCRGSLALGSGCGTCERCQYEKEHGPWGFSRTMMVPEESGYAPIELSREYMDKHKPEVGGYYVVYEDGYKSYSPAAPFEAGYTLRVRENS